MTLIVDALITRADRGDRSAADALFDTLYAELHRLAWRELGHHGRRPGALGVTTLLHEAYLVICDRAGTVFPDRARFMAYASRVMRGLIIDDVRRRLAQKRGGKAEHTSIHPDLVVSGEDPEWLGRVSDALDDLGKYDPDLAEIIDLKFFCGFSFVEIARMRGVSERAVQRSWEKGRLYLHETMSAWAGMA